MLGEVFGQRYRIVSRLGKGGMGVTYRAWDTIGGRPVVVKKPQRRFVDAPGFLDRFRREIDVLVKVPHPHIVPVLDVGQHEFLPFYVMRFLPGGSLADRRLRDAAGGPRPMRPSTLHLWIWQAAAALDHVHSAGVVHRDVKPANIFFDAGWHAFLGDFGVAKDLRALPGEDITGERDAPGTEKYMAPEQFDHAALVDGRADQYALAVVAYDLLAGRPPFVGDAAHVVVEITSHPAPPIERFRGDLPESCRAGLMRALAKRPEDRFSTCTEFASALLGDVEPLSVEVGVARFLCPNCRTILRLPTTAGGEQGRCSRCHKGMMVAPDLSALWLLSETFATPPATEPEPTSTTVFGPDDPDPRRLPQDAVPTVTVPPPPTPPRIPPATAARAAAPAEARTVRRVHRRRHDLTLPLAGVALLVAIPTVIWPAARAWFDPVGAALATLETSPDDPLANGVVGRELARDGDWGRALRHLEASQRPDYRAAARRELRARAAAPPDPGELLEVARAWWRFPGLGTVEPADRQAIERHAADTYLEAVDRLEDLGDIEDVNAWLDRDKRFRALVGDRRPAVPKAGGGPRSGKSAGR